MVKPKVFIIFQISFLLFECSQKKSDISRLETDSVNAMIYSGVHDPAQLVNINNELVLFASAVEWSTYAFGSSHWQFKGDDIYSTGKPSWYNGSNLWAPSIYTLDATHFRLYHSAVINEDNHQSRIGFVSIDANDRKFLFSNSEDYVIESENTQQPFAIDPAVFKDDNNRVWLVYGSHAKGIWITELNIETGLLKTNPQDKTWDSTDTRFIEIANYGGNLDENNVEAAYIYNHPESAYYYLFVNWDVCCSGVNSTYNIRVGKSKSPTGPFLDKDGIDLKSGGGTLFLDANGEIIGDDRFKGPGHAGIYRHHTGKYYFSHHFYDGDHHGDPSLAFWNLDWENGWPVLNSQQETSI